MAVANKNAKKVRVKILKRFVYSLEEVGPDTTKDGPVEMPLDDFRLYSSTGFVEEWKDDVPEKKKGTVKSN